MGYVIWRCQLTCRTVAASLHEHAALGEKLARINRTDFDDRACLRKLLQVSVVEPHWPDEYTQRPIFTLEMNNLMIFLKCYLIMSLWWVMCLSHFEFEKGTEEKGQQPFDKNTAEAQFNMLSGN